MNTKRMNRLEELGRVDNEKAYTKKGKRNLKDEKKRVVDELKMKKGGKVKGYDEGGKVTMTSMKKDKEGRAMAKNKKKMTKSQMADAAGRAMIGKPVGAPKKARSKKMMMGGKVKGYKKGGAVGSASKRADGCATKGHTRGRMV